MWKLLAQRTSWDFFQALSYNVAWKVSKITVFLCIIKIVILDQLAKSFSHQFLFLCSSMHLCIFLELEFLGKLTLCYLCPFLLVHSYTLFSHYSAEILLVLSTFLLTSSLKGPQREPFCPIPSPKLPSRFVFWLFTMIKYLSIGRFV